MMSRFVVLFHEMPPLSERASHYDWMFELGGSLRTWIAGTNSHIDSILSHSKIAFEFRCPAKQLADHRAAYLDYEGPVSNNRGTVTRRLAGEFHQIHNEENSFQATICIGEPIKRDPIEIQFKKEGEQWWLIVGKRTANKCNQK